MISYRFYVGTGRVRLMGHRASAVTAANTEALRLFGGYTLLVGEGGWRPGGDLPDTQEETLVWEVIGEEGPAVYQRAKHFASFYLKHPFDQDVVLMTITEVKTEEV